MTPLAQKIARQMVLPKRERVLDNPNLFSYFERDLHCFDVQAIAKSIQNAMDEGNLWPDVADILPDLFLPSPVTWLEFTADNKRLAYILEQVDGWLKVSVAWDAGRSFSVYDMGRFRACSIIHSADRILVEINEEANEEWSGFEAERALPSFDDLKYGAYAKNLAATKKIGADHAATIGWMTTRKEIAELQVSTLRSQAERLEMTASLMSMAKEVIAFAVLAIDLINTPGIIGMRSHAPHAGLAKKLSRLGVGKFPLRAWSEVTIKSATKIVEKDLEASPSFHKCLHFVRSHKRHYRDGRISVVSAHWRGDPALGIKRTRYRVSA